MGFLEIPGTRHSPLVFKPNVKAWRKASTVSWRRAFAYSSRMYLTTWEVRICILEKDWAFLKLQKALSKGHRNLHSLEVLSTHFSFNPLIEALEGFVNVCRWWIQEIFTTESNKSLTYTRGKFGTPIVFIISCRIFLALPSFINRSPELLTLTWSSRRVQSSWGIYRALKMVLAASRSRVTEFLERNVVEK